MRPEQAPSLPGGDVRIAIVESVRSRVEAKRTVRERPRVAPDSSARFEDARRHVAASGEHARGQPAGAPAPG